MAPSPATTADIRLDIKEAAAFVSALGKNGDTRMRGFSPWKGSGRKNAISSELALQWQQEGLGLYIVINNGGDTDDAIKDCVAIFCEWDDRPIEWQVTAWQELNLPEPSIQVDSGGKSIHNYWIFREPIAVDQWRNLQERLITHTSSDPKLKNPSRVMRLPGTWHLSPGAAQPEVVIDRLVKVVHTSDHRYSFNDLDSSLKPLPTPELQTPRLSLVSTSTLPADTIHLSDLLPKDQSHTFSSGVSEGVRNDECFKLAINLLGIEQRCSLLGSSTLGFHVQGTAADCLEDFNQRCSPPLPPNELKGVLSSASQSNPEPDANLVNRIAFHRRRLHPSASVPAAKKSQPSLEGLDISQDLTPIDQWDRFLRSLVDHSQPAFERNSVRRQIRAATAARELGVSASPQHVRAALLQHQRNLITGTEQKGTKGGEKAKFKPKEYLINNLIAMRCLTGIAAFNKVGKTKLATELVASLIHQRPFMGNPDWQPAPPPPGGHKFILWWVDQPGVDSQTYLMARGLMEPDRTLHPQIAALYTEEDDLAWDDQGMDRLIQDTANNPGAILITDSFFACIQRVHGSDQEPEAGGALIDVQTLLSQTETTHICLFHSPKETGPVGINAIRGHSSAGGAVSGTISLHFLEKKDPQNNKWVADKDNPHRHMVFEGRGPYIDLLIRGDWEQGTFQVLGNFQLKLAELTADERKASVIDDLTEGQLQTLEWVGTATGICKASDGVTARQVAGAMIHPRQPTASEVETTRKKLNALVKKQLLTMSRKSKVTRYNYRAVDG